MCLCPIKIYNPVKEINPNYNQRFEIEVPCGQCAECKEQIKNEWFFRAYWQCNDCFDHNGYIYFDTLTYNDANLPHISDIDSSFKNRIIDYPCFSQAHWKSFIDCLRVYLVRDGWVIDGKLKYFMSSEYGTSEHGTHRPHYHVLLFVQVNRRYDIEYYITSKGQKKKRFVNEHDEFLDPMLLCEYVNRSWNRGFVDNYQHQFVWKDDRNYVKHHTYGKGYTEDDKYLRAVCQYVAKYVMKDSEFQKDIDKRLSIMFNDKLGIDDQLTYYDQEQWRKLLRQVGQFHRQSQGFGLYFKEKFEGDVKQFFMDKGLVELPVAKRKKFKHIYIPMPHYLFNKIFKDRIFDMYGKPYDVLNEEGREFKYQQIIRNIDLTVDRYKELMNNIVNTYITPLDELMDENGKPYYLDQNSCLEKGLHMKKRILDLLSGRDIKEYVIYSLLYKGRLKSDRARETGEIDDLQDMIVNMYVDNRYEINSDVRFYNYQQRGNRRYFGKNFVSSKMLYRYDEDGNILYDSRYNAGYDFETESCNNGIKDICEKLSRFGSNIALDSFMFRKLYCYNSDNTKDFRGFDELFNVFRDCYYYINRRKQKLFDWNDQRAKRKKEQKIYKSII